MATCSWIEMASSTPSRSGSRLHALYAARALSHRAQMADGVERAAAHKRTFVLAPVHGAVRAHVVVQLVADSLGAPCDVFAG